jgi:hypothetical protein
MTRAVPLLREVRCVACATHARPQDVPWHQHAVGCAMRGATLAMMQPPATLVGGRATDSIR